MAISVHTCISLCEHPCAISKLKLVVGLHIHAVWCSYIFIFAHNRAGIEKRRNHMQFVYIYSLVLIKTCKNS